MITEQALQEAIAECHGERNPNANTCMKLAAYYTIQDHLGGSDNAPVLPVRSFAPAPEVIEWEGDSEFARIARELPVSYIMPIIDELMEAVEVLQPRLYAGVMRKLRSRE